MPEWVRIVLVCGLLAAFPACGKNIDKQVRDSARTFAGSDLPRQHVEVLDVNESGDFAIAEVRVRTALKYKKSGDEWVLEEIRLGDRRWEKASHILRAIEEERRQTTRNMLEKIRTAIDEYRQKQGGMPVVQSFEDLINLLTPNYLNPPIRLDGWSNPFSFQVNSPGGYQIRSSGPDGEEGNDDDIVAGR